MTLFLCFIIISSIINHNHRSEFWLSPAPAISSQYLLTSMFSQWTWGRGLKNFLIMSSASFLCSVVISACASLMFLEKWDGWKEFLLELRVATMTFKVWADPRPRDQFRKDKFKESKNWVIHLLQCGRRKFGTTRKVHMSERSCRREITWPCWRDLRWIWGWWGSPPGPDSRGRWCRWCRDPAPCTSQLPPYWLF